MIRPNGFKIFHHAFIKSMPRDRGAVADDDQLAAGIGEEANFIFTVRADEAEIDLHRQI
jgi:hypothetical protein